MSHTIIVEHIPAATVFIALPYIDLCSPQLGDFAEIDCFDRFEGSFRSFSHLGTVHGNAIDTVAAGLHSIIPILPRKIESGITGSPQRVPEAFLSLNPKFKIVVVT